MPTSPIPPQGFLERPFTRDLSACDAVVLGVPYDLATTGRAGTREGPQGVRRASWQMSWEERRWPWRFALSERLSVIDYGDVIFDPGNNQQMVDVLQDDARTLLAAGKTILTLGGDHYISLPLLREHFKAYGPVSLVHFDAHTDTEPIEGTFNHGSMFREALKEGLLDPAHSVQIGLRTTNDDTLGFNILDGPWVHENGIDAVVAETRKHLGDRPVYLSFDIDCLDPSYAPGTGTPVCGGLTTHQAIQIIRGLIGINLIGMDIVEVAPIYDVGEITALAGATLAVEMINTYENRPGS